MKIIVYSLALWMLAACSGELTDAMPHWQQSDRHLDCQQLELEMNDANYWKVVAGKRLEMGMEDYLFPFPYLYHRSDARQALARSGTRLKNLQNVYAIKGCNVAY